VTRDRRYRRDGDRHIARVKPAQGHPRPGQLGEAFTGHDVPITQLPPPQAALTGPAGQHAPAAEREPKST
jgi:hypothetical protein